MLNLLERALVTRTPGRGLEIARTVSRFVMVAFYYLAGIRHLRVPDDFAAMIPPAIPAHHGLVIFTGWCEILGATGLLIPQSRKLTGLMLAIYAVCVYPANIYQAVAHIPFHGAVLGWGYHVPRLALQPILVWWALFCAGVTTWPFHRRANPPAVRQRAR